MRYLLFLVWLLFLAPVGLAQEGPAVQTHLSVKATELGPFANETIPIATGEGPWLQGMILIIYVAFAQEPSPLHVDLQHGDGTLAQRFRFIEPEGFQSTMIPRNGEDGDYQLVLRNPGNTSLAFFLYFDQTCACAAKPIPLPHGTVVFHFDLLGGKEYNIGVPSVEGWNLTAILSARKPGLGSEWPHSFDTLDEGDIEGKGWLNLRHRPTEKERVYLWVRADEGVVFPPPQDPGAMVQITPLVEIVEPSKGLPAPPAVLLVGVILAVAYSTTSKQRTGAPKSKA